MNTTTTIKVKTIDTNAKEWFDKVNGNSYFSAQATVNFGMPDQKTVKVPFQYGYGEQYKYAAFKALQDAGILPPQDGLMPPHIFCSENKIIARYSKQENCKKRDVVAYGL